MHAECASGCPLSQICRPVNDENSERSLTTLPVMTKVVVDPSVLRIAEHNFRVTYEFAFVWLSMFSSSLFCYLELYKVTLVACSRDYLRFHLDICY